MHQEAGQFERQPGWLLALFALAAAGGSVAYTPFLTVLLPLRIARLSGHDDVSALAQLTFAGAVMASVANIAFGMLSDRWGYRHRWIAAGAFLSGGLLLVTQLARDGFELLCAVIAWQLALNMMLGPLLAWAGDCIPDRQKGIFGGLLAFAPMIGALSGSLVTIDHLADATGRLLIVAALVIAMVMPVVIWGRGRERPELMRAPPKRAARGLERNWPVVMMWMARLLVQIAEAGLFAFLLFWLRSLSPDIRENLAANLLAVVLAIALLLALLLGRWSDRHERPIAPLVLCALFASLGLAIMAMAQDLQSGITGYLVFGVAGTAFLSLHTGQTLRLLPNPRHRGRDLGFFNLTNTLPSMAIPWIVIALMPAFGFTGFFALLALCSVLSAICLVVLAKALAPS